jgi:hypothetical protein
MDSGQWTVNSGQWTVNSEQWTVNNGQKNLPAHCSLFTLI